MDRRHHHANSQSQYDQLKTTSDSASNGQFHSNVKDIKHMSGLDALSIISTETGNSLLTAGTECMHALYSEA